MQLKLLRKEVFSFMLYNTAAAHRTLDVRSHIWTKLSEDELNKSRVAPLSASLLTIKPWRWVGLTHVCGARTPKNCQTSIFNKFTSSINAKKTTKTANEVSFEWPHQRNFTTDTKVRTTFQASIIYSKVFSVEGRLRNFKGWKIQLANTNQLTSFSLEHNFVARKYLCGSLRILFTSDQERILARQKSV